MTMYLPPQQWGWNQHHLPATADIGGWGHVACVEEEIRFARFSPDILIMNAFERCHALTAVASSLCSEA